MVGSEIKHNAVSGLRKRSVSEGMRKSYWIYVTENDAGPHEGLSVRDVSDDQKMIKLRGSDKKQETLIVIGGPHW